MEDFTKTVRMGVAETRDGSVFATIKFVGGKLSITGVEGPLGSGDCKGGCGQIDMHLRERSEPWAALAEGWTPELVARFLKVWDDWHLNDMRAYTSEMEAAGWREQAKREVLRYRFTPTTQASNDKRQVEAQAMAALKAGEAFTPTEWQTQQAKRPYEIVTTVYPTEPEPSAPDGFERAKDYRTGKIENPERKTLGWLKQSEHSDGLLSRALVEGGPTYGGSWYRQDVPADVLEFLKGLPDADRPLPGSWGR